MTKQEINDFLDIIEANYNNFFKGYTEKKIKIVKQTWYAMFNNVTVDVMLKALYGYMATNGKYPPSQSDIRKQISVLAFGEEIPADESFNKIMKLIRRFGWERYSIAREYFTPLEKQIVTKEYFKEMALSTNDTEILRGQYSRFYLNKKENVIRNQQLTLNSDKDLIAAVNRKMLENK